MPENQLRLVEGILEGPQLNRARLTQPYPPKFLKNLTRALEMHASVPKYRPFQLFFGKCLMPCF